MMSHFCLAKNRRALRCVSQVLALVTAIPFARAQDCGEPVDFGFEVQSSMFLTAADCSIAVGSSSILASTNAGLWLFDRDGTEIANQTLSTFFGGGADTVCAWDALSQRYFALTLRGRLSLRLAVSKSSNPTLDTGDWYFFDFTDLPGDVDFPGMSVGEDYVYITWARLGSGPAGRAVIASLTKDDLIAGQTPTMTQKDVTAISGQYEPPMFRAIGCMKLYEEPAEAVGYFITDSHKETGVNTLVRLYALNASDNSLSTYDLTVPDYFTAPVRVDVPGTNNDVLCNWDFKFPVYRNGSAWAAHAIGPEVPQEEPNTAKVRWYEIAMNGWPYSDNDPELVQSGTIDPGEDISAWYPAIHVDDEDNVAIAYNQASATQHPAIYRQIRKWYDDEDELRAPLLLKQSESSPSGQLSWADYSAMDEDPHEDFAGVMWSHLMWFEGTSTRKTWLARTDLNKSLTLEIDYECESCEPGEIKRGTDVKLTVKGAAPGNLVRWYYSFYGCGETYIGDPLYVTLEISSAVFLGSSYADGSGTAVK